MNKEIVRFNTLATTSEQMKSGYKKTSVGIVPQDWQVFRLGELIQIINGISPSSLSLLKRGVYPYLKVDSLNYNNKYVYESVYYSNEERYLVPKNSLIFPKRGAAILNNKIRINKKIVQLDSNLMALVPMKSIIIEFLFYKIKYEKLYRVADTSTIPQINNKHIEPYSICIPKVEEQKSIADCLSTWDLGIEKLTQLIQAKKQQKKGLMQQLLSGTLRLCSPSGEKFVEEWKEVRLGDHFKERNENGFNDLELLSIGEEGVYPQAQSNKKDISNADKSKYKLIEEGDIGYNTMRLWQGRLALSSLRGIVSPAYTIVTPISNKANSNFFAYFFKMPFVVFKFYRNSQGMVSDTLQCRYKDFKKIKVLIPSLQEQTAIANILQIADKEIELLEQKLSSFQQQKKGLMQVLLTGEKRLIE